MDDAGEGGGGEGQGVERRDPAEHAGAGVGVDESVKNIRYFILKIIYFHFL